MGVIELLVAASGLFVAFGFPLLGIVVYQFISPGYSTETERQDDLPPAHGRESNSRRIR